MSTAFFIDAVPSTFSSNLSWLFDTEVFQLKAAEETNYKAGDSVLVFNYSIAQVTIKYSNQRENIFQFLINMCAIVGGVFTVASMVDGAIHKTSRVILKG
jgi:hypothetical protein